LPIRISSVVRLVGASACWGLGTVLSKDALSSFSPLRLLCIQLAASVAVLVLLLQINRVPAVWSGRLYAIVALGVLNPGVAYWLGLIGLGMTTATVASLIWAVEPALIVVAARIVLRQRIGGRVLALLLPATLGVVLVIGSGPISGSWLGGLLILAGVGACALYAVFTQQVVAKAPLLLVLTIQQASALVFAVVLSILPLEHPAAIQSASSDAVWVRAIVSGIIYYAIAFWLFVGALRDVAATTAGLFISLVPVFAIVAAFVILNERPGGWQWFGAALVFSAMALVVRERRLSEQSRVSS
jgi:probable blue pigment (indigoidine) exporter